MTISEGKEILLASRPDLSESQIVAFLERLGDFLACLQERGEFFNKQCINTSIWEDGT